MSNVKMSLESPVVAVLSPLSQAAGSRSTVWVAAKDFFNFMAVVGIGVVGASATVDAKIEQATSSAGAGAKDVAGKSIAQVVASDKSAVINFCQNDLDMTSGFTHVRVTLAVGVAATLTAATLLGGDARFEKATNTIADQVI